MKRLCQSLIWAIGATAVLLPPLRAEETGWAVPDAAFRLRLVPEGVPAPASAGYCLLAAGAAPPDQASVRVTDAAGRPTPSTVLRARRGEPLLLAFETVSGATSYWAYVRSGGPAGDPAWRPRAGVLLETRSLDRPAHGSHDQFEQAWKAASNVFGVSFRKEIFDGLHPHGPPSPLLARYEAWFRLTKGGEYAFATLSEDASFLSVDGKPVAEWPGLHGLDGGRHGEKKGLIGLEPGLHCLVYESAQADAQPYMVAAWRPPGIPQFAPMKPTDFERIDRYTCATAESRPPLPPAPHFEWRITQSARIDSCLLAEAAFRAMPVEGAEYGWDFGDGTRGRGAATNHVYLGAGLRQVRLEFRRPGQPPAVLEQAVDIHPVWSQAEECPDWALTPLREAYRARPPSEASLDELGRAIQYADRLGDELWLEQLGEACLARGGPFPGPFHPRLESAARAFRRPRFGLFEKTETLYGLAAAAAALDGNKRAVARIALNRAENRINGLFRFEQALELLEAIAEADLDEPARRLRRLYTADALMSLGRRDDAWRVLRAIPCADSNTLGAVRLQARLATAADLVRRQEWDAAAERLEAILNDYPPERFRGETGLLLMEAWAGRGETIPALVMAERLLKADLLDDVHARLLLRAADLHRILEDAGSANRYLDELKREFPYSEAAAQAPPAP